MLHQAMDLTSPRTVGSEEHRNHHLSKPNISPTTTDLTNLKQVFPVNVKAPLQELHSLDTMQVTRRTYRCSDCGYETNRRNNLKRHISTMHEVCEKKLECCGMEFGSKAELRKHIQSRHRNGYNCSVCGKVFCRKALLKRHLTVHSGQKEFNCDLCGYATSHKSNLERHKKVHTKAFEPSALDRYETSSESPTDSVVSFGSPPDLLMAPSSDEIDMSISDEELEEHEDKKSQDIRLWKNPYKCSVCCTLLSTQRELAKHRKREHYQLDKLLDTLAIPITRRYILLHRARHSSAHSIY